MTAFLGLLKDKYGGAEGYLKQYVTLSEEDIETIRSNLVVSPSAI